MTNKDYKNLAKKLNYRYYESIRSPANNLKDDAIAIAFKLAVAVMIDYFRTDPKFDHERFRNAVYIGYGEY